MLGAVEVGMLRALFEREHPSRTWCSAPASARSTAPWSPASPTSAVVERLTELWQSMSSAREAGYGDRRAAHRPPGGRLGHPPVVRRAAAAAARGASSATSPSRSCRSPSRSARPASSARPSTGSPAAGSWTPWSPAPPYPGCCRRPRSDDEHYLDGGIVNSIPLGRAVELGATRVFVLQVGRLDRPLKPPKRPWEVARVSFEIARRHRFVRELAELPDDGRVPRAAGPRHVGPRRHAAGQPRLLRRTGPHRRDVRRLAGLPRRAPVTEAAAGVVVTASGGPRGDLAALGPASALAGRRGRALTAAARAAGGRCGCSGSSSSTRRSTR